MYCQQKDKVRIRASKSILRGTLFLFVTSVLVFHFPAVMAQENDEESYGIEEIVVTARKTEERLQEVPLSITAFSFAEIESKSLFSLKDLGQLNRSVGFQDSYGLLNARLTYAGNNNRWSDSLFGTNLTDELYIMAATDLSDTPAFGEVQWARPREWGLSLKYNC